MPHNRAWEYSRLGNSQVCDPGKTLGGTIAKDPLCQRFRERWPDFERTTSEVNPSLVADYEQIEPHIGPFLGVVQFRFGEINSDTGEVLDYEREPSLKAIAIGGNRLSRGLTLEGLLCSFFIRKRSTNYDTLMQMGRWFWLSLGLRRLDANIHHSDALPVGSAILVRLVEHRLREDVKVYEHRGVTPRELGTRILQHPTMQVDKPSETAICQSNDSCTNPTLSLSLKHSNFR